MNMMLLDSYTAGMIERNMPSDEALTRLSEFFDAMSDVTRLKLLSVLSASAMCVTDLAAVCSLNQTTVSHQLRILKAQRLVECKRQGKVMFYSLANGNFSGIMDLAVGSVFNGENL